MRLFNRCPHMAIRAIHGDEINHLGGYRLACLDCGRLLDGPEDLANWHEVYLGDLMKALHVNPQMKFRLLGNRWYVEGTHER